MTKKVLVITDAQNEFITGALGNKECEAAVKNIVAAAESGEYYKVIITKDTHTADYLNTQEGKHLPVTHCITRSWGWDVCDELLNSNFGEIEPMFLDKPTFGYKDWETYLYQNGIDGNDSEFTFTGTVGSICVVNNALIIKSQFPESTVKCLSDCVADLSESDKNATLTVMKNSQIEVL